MNGEPLLILLVEDDPGHAQLILRNFERHHVANEVRHIVNGKLALDYLFRRGEYADPAESPRPHLILLDLRLPKIDGFEVLEEIKGDEDLRTIPVVILTSSDADRDVARATLNHANSYLVKPVQFQDFAKLISDLGSYWLALNRQPANRQG